jgi:hypothetical protein
MYLINEANFTRELSVPNLSSSQSGNAERLALYGDEKPRLLLQMSLGNVLFSQLNSQVTNGVLNTDADQKWKDLVNGKTYDGKDWKGLNYLEGSFKVSLLAYYTFWMWLNDNVNTMGSGGEVQVQSKNANNVNPTSYQVQIWNKFIELYQGLPYNYCFPNVSYYDGTTFVDYYNGGINSNYVSLLQFLKDNPINYPNPQLFTFDNLSNSNSLGL